MKFYTNILTVGNNVRIRGYENGKRFQEKIPYKPTLFLPTKEKTKYTTLHGKYVAPREFDTIKEAKKFLDDFSEIQNFEVYGQENFSTCISNEHYGHEDFQFDADLIRICYIDIEVASENGFPEPEQANEQVLLITLKQGDKLITLGLGDFNPPSYCQYIKCENEIVLLTKFLKIWRKFDPDIATGFNTDGFDIPYLYNRITKILSLEAATSLSPYDLCWWTKPKFSKNQDKNVKIAGVDCIDYRDIYRKYGITENLESYSLNSIAHFELKEKKLDYSKYTSLHHLYRENFQLYTEYNIQDVLLVERIEKKLKLIQMVIFISYMSGTNFEDVYNQTRIWDSIIYRHLQKQDVIIPIKKRKTKSEQYAGAWVKEPVPGTYDWVLSYDFEGLYPAIIITHNIGVETLVTDVPKLDCTVETLLEGNVQNPHPQYSMTANGYFFRKDKQSFLAFLLEKMGEERSKYKKLMLEHQKLYEQTKDPKHKALSEQYEVWQKTIKVCRNSVYGALGTEFFRFFDIRLAEAITTSSQLTTRFSIQKMNGFMNDNLKMVSGDFILASDTDSMYVNFGPFVSKHWPTKTKKQKLHFLKRLDKEVIAPKIVEWIKELDSKMSYSLNRIYLKREVIAERGIWTAKKRYALAVWDKEGITYKYPKTKITGLEAIRGSVPVECRKRLVACIKMLLYKNEKMFRDYVATFEKKYHSLPFEQIAIPVGVSNLEKNMVESDYGVEWKSGTPVHVRASYVFNNALKQYNLTQQYEPIKSADKLKWCYMKIPNPLGENVMACKTVLPKELALDEFIDYDKQFQNTFIKPLEPLVEARGWSIKETHNLLSYFS